MRSGGAWAARSRGCDWSWIEAMARASHWYDMFPASWVRVLESVSGSDGELPVGLLGNVVGELRTTRGAMQRNCAAVRERQLDK